MNRRSFFHRASMFLTGITFVSSGNGETSKASGISRSSVDLSRLLQCIAEVETGNDDTRVGPKGELSKYQISEAVWTQHMTSDFIKCRGHFALVCAARHLWWLIQHLPIATPYWLAYAWHAGLGRARRAIEAERYLTFNMSEGYHSYALRVSHLYHDPSFSP